MPVVAETQIDDAQARLAALAGSELSPAETVRCILDSLSAAFEDYFARISARPAAKRAAELDVDTKTIDSSSRLRRVPTLSRECVFRS